MTYFNSLLTLPLSNRALALIVNIGLNLEAGEEMKAAIAVDQCSAMSLKKTINELKGAIEDGATLEQINDITYVYKFILTCIKG